jgi:serine/threonine protein kinase
MEERIGEYLIKRLVGEGGMGKVYEAEERLSKRRVALKILRAELTKSDTGRRLFLNEMQILAHLEHPNIVRSLASMEVDGQLVMALEFIDGRTLRDELVGRGRIPWQEAVEVVVGIAQALGVAHTQEPPIIHRDLKPENVMRTPSGELKVMDFGIAKVLEAAHATNTQSVGTLQYMSPEQIDAQTIDTRSDLYSLGLMLYEMVAGAPPFRSASPRELLNMQCTAAPPELADDARVGLPRAIEALMFELLEKSPADRPASAAGVLERLARFRTGSDNARAATSSRRARPSQSGSPPPSPVASSPRATPPSVTPSGTLHSGQPSSARDTGTPDALPRARKPRTDTIDLVERATEPTQVSTPLAVLVIVVLSLLAGVTTYAIRMRGSGASDAPGTATATATVTAAGTAAGARGAARPPTR